MFAALSLMVVGGQHPPFNTVRNVTRWFYTTSNSNEGLVNRATTSAGPNWTSSANANGTHPRWWNSGYQGTGNNVNLNSVTSANYTIGTNDFQFEWWQYCTSIALENNSVRIYMDCRTVLGTTNVPALYATVANGRLQYSNNVTDLITTAAGVIVVNQQQFISICRTGGTTYLGVDGVIVGSAADTTNYGQGPIRMMNAVNGAGGITCWMSEFRFAIGTGAAVRTANFTPPVGPFPINVP